MSRTTARTLTRVRTLSLLAAASALALTGCAADPTTGGDNPDNPDPAPVSLEVTIADGTISPLGAELTAKVGQPIVLEVTSDAEDELHLHAEPEQSFDVTPGEHTFTFEVDVPGTVSLESHHVGGTIASITVRP